VTEDPRYWLPWHNQAQVAFDPSGNMYIGDTSSERIRES